MDFHDEQTLRFIRESLTEDIGDGDHSTLGCIPHDSTGKSKLLFKEEGIVAGIELAKAILHELDPDMHFEQFMHDGDSCKPGDIGFIATGSVHALLSGERLLLNCMQRLSGIATQTHRLVELMGNSRSKLLDTRKTTPGFRFLEKWAVTVGGGYNHRIGLYDMVMLKDNHIDFAGGITKAVEASRNYLLNMGLELKIEVETRNIREVEEALNCEGVDRIMLDNFTPEEIVVALKLIDGRVETEASGGINESNLAAYAATNIDYISIGALTHSVKSLDISLKEVD
ncbi:MAG: carboxylating nicotinate-nucleotide diphosphorylase [Bacteroidetes bacterium]|nr:carboxylating nicotinate-nucleotide diphosphorylase [Bacteroidota bacterium]